MSDIVGVRFKRAGKVNYFDPVGMDLEIGDRVVVETVRGLDLGEVVIAPKQVLASEFTEPLKAILRKAGPQDMAQDEESKLKKQEAFAKCEELIVKFHLPMRLLDANYTLDGSRFTFFFSAEGRIDFRELLRELSSSLKARVELVQVGPRDEAKLMGGMGRCGRSLCCASFLTEFLPVSIRMAKEQDLPLSPMKISGICGRLLCCLGYESTQYRLLKKKLPPIGKGITTPSGPATVIGGNPLKETVLVKLEDGATLELPLSQITAEDS